MTRQRFYPWLMRWRSLDDRVGDLARDAHEDASFPRRADEVVDYLESVNAIPAAIETAKIALGLWRAGLAPGERNERVERAAMWWR